MITTTSLHVSEKMVLVAATDTNGANETKPVSVGVQFPFFFSFLKIEFYIIDPGFIESQKFV